MARRITLHSQRMRDVRCHRIWQLDLENDVKICSSAAYLASSELLQRTLLVLACIVVIIHMGSNMTCEVASTIVVASVVLYLA